MGACKIKSKNAIEKNICKLCFVFYTQLVNFQCWTKGQRCMAVAEDLRPTAMVAEV